MTNRLVKGRVRDVVGIVGRVKSIFIREKREPDDEAARRAGKAMREDMETLRTGAITGANPWLTHGGKESRGR